MPMRIVNGSSSNNDILIYPPPHLYVAGGPLPLTKIQALEFDGKGQLHNFPYHRNEMKSGPRAFAALQALGTQNIPHDEQGRIALFRSHLGI